MTGHHRTSDTEDPINWLFSKYAYTKYIYGTEHDTVNIDLDVIINRITTTLLSERQRTVLNLYFNDCRTQQEIADELNICQSTVSDALKRGMDTTIKVLSVYDPRFRDCIGYTTKRRPRRRE